jgi:hypothetical protein
MAKYDATTNAPAFSYAEVDTSLIPPRARKYDVSA